MNLSPARAIISKLYSDKMSITRLQEVVGADGTTNVIESDEPLYKDIACRISFSSVDNPDGITDSNNPQHLQIKVFCDPNIDVKKGDTLVVERFNEDGSSLASYKGTANLPLSYVTHKEILLVNAGDA
jgi:hypothetical protein